MLHPPSLHLAATVAAEVPVPAAKEKPAPAAEEKAVEAEEKAAEADSEEEKKAEEALEAAAGDEAAVIDGAGSFKEEAWTGWARAARP